MSEQPVSVSEQMENGNKHEVLKALTAKYDGVDTMKLAQTLVRRRTRWRRPTVTLEGFMNVYEAANFIGVSERTLLRWYKDGSGPPRKVYKQRIFYNREKLLSWVHGPKEEN